jgi:hypothetical protein
MNFFAKFFQEGTEGVQSRTRKREDYVVNGFSQTRNGISFIENNFSANVIYREDLSGPVQKINYRVTNLKQSCVGLIFQFAQCFNKFTADLELQINDGFEVTAILNHNKIIQSWTSGRHLLKEKFKSIPDVDNLLDNYEKSIKNEGKLRNSIFYTGIAQLFFPRIKQLFRPPVEQKRFLRKRFLDGFYFGLKIPIKEELTIRNGNKILVASIYGSLDIDGIENKEEFLRAFRMLYGEEVKLGDISFQAKEKYELSYDLECQTGEIEQYFEVKGVHFKKDKIAYKQNQ